jgi:hypothetical protein
VTTISETLGGNWTVSDRPRIRSSSPSANFRSEPPPVIFWMSSPLSSSTTSLAEPFR